MYYQLNKIYQQKHNFSILLLYLIVLFTFVSPKLNFYIYDFQIRTDYLIYFLIFIFSFLYFEKSLDKNDLKIFILFFLLNFFLSFYEKTFNEFIKQFILIGFIYIALKSYCRKFNEKKFLEIYKKVGFIIIIIGYILFFISLSQSVFISKFFLSINENTYLVPMININIYEVDNFWVEISTYKNNHLFYLSEILQIKSPSRFQSICSEPATYAILTSPLLFFYLKEIKKNYLKIFLLIFSIILSQSVYGFLGIVLSVLGAIKLNYKTILICILLVITSLTLPGGKLIDLFKKSFSVFNVGFNETDWDKEVKKYSDAFNTSSILLRFEDYQSDFYPKLSEEDKNILISQIKIEELFDDKKLDIKIFKEMLEKYNFNVYNPSDSIYIRTTGCAYLSNLFISIENLKNFRIFGSGLGSHEIVYKKNIKNWNFMKSNSSHCLGLNFKDGKSYFIRVFTEFGLIGLILLFYFFLILKNKNNEVEKFSKILLILLFMQTGNYGLLKVNIFILLLIKNSNLNSLFTKFQKNH